METLSGPVETDESYFGGKRKNMPKRKRKALQEASAGRGTVGKKAVVGMKDRGTGQVRARIVESTDKPTLSQHDDSQGLAKLERVSNQALRGSLLV